MDCNNLMIIDDDRDALLIYSIMVKKLGFSDCYEPIMNGTKALMYLKTCDIYPDVIAVDLSMPGVDGFKFLSVYEKDLYHKHPDTKVVVLTSSVRQIDYDKAMRFGFVSEFVSQPLKSLKLLEFFVMDSHHTHA